MQTSRVLLFVVWLVLPASADAAVRAVDAGAAAAPMGVGRVIHGEFLVGTRFLPEAWRPDQNLVVFGGSVGIASRRRPIGFDGGFLVGLGGELNPHGGASSSVFELFLGAGKGWVSATRGKYLYYGVGPSLVVGGMGPTSNTTLGGYIRGGGGLARLSRTRLGIDFRYAYGARLDSRRTDGFQICLTLGAAHLR